LLDLGVDLNVTDRIDFTDFDGGAAFVSCGGCSSSSIVPVHGRAPLDACAMPRRPGTALALNARRDSIHILTASSDHTRVRGPNTIGAGKPRSRIHRWSVCLLFTMPRAISSEYLMYRCIRTTSVLFDSSHDGT
jgi:hypothetical protein